MHRTEQGIVKRTAKPRTRREFVVRAKEIIESNYHRSISISELAGLVSVSVDHLRHAFSEEVGQSPTEYLTQVRIAHAKELLKAGKPIKEVVSLVGFFDQAHLTRHFRREMHITPAKFVRKWQQH